MKGFFLPLLALAVLFTASFASQSASAASDYDGVLTVAEQPLPTGTTTRTALEFGTFIKEYSYGACQTDADIVFDAISSGDDYVITQMSYASYPSTQYYYIYVSTSNTAEYSWTTTTLQLSNWTHQLSFIFDGSSIYTDCSQTSTTNPISTTFRTLEMYKYVEGNVSITYPTDYEGEILPITGNETEKETRRPHFTFQQYDKKITANPYAPEPTLPDFTPELDEGYYHEGYYIGWNVWKCPTEFDSVTGTCADSGILELIDEELKGVSDPYELTLSEYGSYQLEAEYWAQSCYRYPSYPATPDYCFYSKLRAHFLTSDFEYVNTFKNLIVDGRTITGNTKGEVCNVGGYCQPSTAICYELESFIEKMNCQLADTMSVGLLNPSIQAIKQLLNGIIVPSNPTCSIPLQNITVASQVIPVSTLGPQLCASAAQVRTGFPIVSILVNAAFALSILSFVIYRINRLLDNNKHDVLERV